jgi:methylglutaconyl-CoA hydratase
MQPEEEILISTLSDTATVLLNRPEKGNALTFDMIGKLTEKLQEIEKQDEIRFVFFRANGRHFCTGADLEWMADAVNLTGNDNLNECIRLAELYETIYSSNKIYVAKVDGTCIGGGVGLVAACDFIYATENAFFLFSEVKLGLVPAIIAPYIIFRTGTSKAKYFMLTGKRISAGSAIQIGLVDFLVDSANIDGSIEKLIEMLRYGEKNAQKMIKTYIHEFEAGFEISEQKIKTATITARFRVSKEGVEGIQAFLEKRQPGWRT